MPVIWTDQVFSSVDADDKLATSAAIGNPNNKNSIEVTVIYSEITPDGDNNAVNFLLQAFIEREIDQGVWVPVATQFKRINGTSDPRQHQIVMSPAHNADPGTPVFYDQGGQLTVARSHTEESARQSGDLRVCLFAHRLDTAQPNDLTSVKVSAYYRLFDL